MKPYLAPGTCSLADHIALHEVEAWRAVRRALQHEGLA
jgi:hypothetical protein